MLKLTESFKTGVAREHAYRAAFEQLMEASGNINAVNDPTRSEHGNPDFVFLNKNNKNLILGYAETKDLGDNLDFVEQTEQIRRYLGYSNLLLTNYLEFRFYRNGEKYQTIEIGKKSGSEITLLPDNYSQFEREIKAFLDSKPERITNGKRLAEIMGGKAARIKANVSKFLEIDNEKNTELLRIYEVIKKLLVHDLAIDKFADMYAQTLVYGLFVARYYDTNPESFSRSEARDLIPASNPFLQHFFDHIAGANFDPRLRYIVDELCEVFSVSDIQSIIQRHYNLLGEVTDKDPIIHFYEDFLKEYDPQLRKKMGAYYTPVPVVNFIVRAVDDILKKDFSLPQGLADTSKIEQKYMLQGTKAKKIVNKVQVIDPAVGTATFLNETIKFIFEKFKGQEGAWKSYVERELLPRLYGFELMMAPYTIAHLKLAMTLKETGIEEFHRRLGVYLTNSLEEGVPAQQSLFGIGFGQTIAEESEQAANIKSNTPIMVVIGNPPYSVSSSNNGEWITNLIKVYKENLNERNIQPLSDDYIKFIRLAEHFIEKNGSGIIAIITNNSFLDGIIHRQMRKHLLETFNDIYILNLHGNSKKKETNPEGGKDENVFEIQQGVSINLLVSRNKTKNVLGKVYYADLYGTRNFKFEFLSKNNLINIKWKSLGNSEPNYFFVPLDSSLFENYSSFFSLRDLFLVGDSGIKTHRDGFVIDFDKTTLKERISDFYELGESDLNSKYGLINNRDFSISKSKERSKFDESCIYTLNYRPFDDRWIYYSRWLVDWPRERTMTHMLNRNNIALIVSRKNRGLSSGYVFISNKITDIHDLDTAADSLSVMPLYLYNLDGTKTSNLNKEIVSKIKTIVGDTTPENIFEYIYAILHSLSYRDKFKDFLKIDFPRIPYPKDKETFYNLVTFGSKLQELHLMEDDDLGKLITSFPISGENLVEKVDFHEGRVFINDLQFFGEVPQEAWGFYIGGYQPAQKWLKDRKGRTLSYEDIMHYQKIIKVLTETEKIMKEIDQIKII